MSLSVKGCWTKIRYLTREAAETAAADQERHFNTPFRVYPCSDRRGRHFHTTSKGSRTASGAHRGPERARCAATTGRKQEAGKQ